MDTNFIVQESGLEERGRRSRDDCPVSLLWLPEGWPGLDPQVWEGANPVVSIYKLLLLQSVYIWRVWGFSLGEPWPQLWQPMSTNKYTESWHQKLSLSKFWLDKDKSVRLPLGKQKRLFLSSVFSSTFQKPWAVLLFSSVYCFLLISELRLIKTSYWRSSGGGEWFGVAITKKKHRIRSSCLVQEELFTLSVSCVMCV